ncbi:MAG: acyltransferase [Isosphaeraceae bacterium]
MLHAPLRHTPRYRLLDAGRGIACLMVVVHHAGAALLKEDLGGSTLRGWIALIFERANLGVTIFFVISGYCIAASADATRRTGFSPRTFLARRFRRIYPPYWASILATLALVVALDLAGLSWLHQGRHAVGIDSPGKLTAAQWVGNVTLTETIRDHFGGPDRNLFTVVAWSLCYEEQFYFLVFLALAIAPRRLFPILVAITAASGAMALGARLTDEWGRVYGLFPALWHDFAVGVAVYYRLNRATRAWARRLLEGLILALAIGSVALVSSVDALLAASFGLLLIAASPFDEALASKRFLAPLMACGHRSYSIYLVHLPIVGLVALGMVAMGLTSYGARLGLVVPISSVLGVAFGWLFFGGIEARFLNPPLPRARKKAVVVEPLQSHQA